MCAVEKPVGEEAAEVCEQANLYSMSTVFLYAMGATDMALPTTNNISF